MALPVSNHQQKYLSDLPRPKTPKKSTMSPSVSPEVQNELNYIAWKNEHAQRKRELRTQFNIWRDHQNQRMCNHQLFKSESKEQSEQLKQMVERRLSNACSCNTCRMQANQIANNTSNSAINNSNMMPTPSSMPHTPS